jgi:hypothetical protein
MPIAARAPRTMPQGNQRNFSSAIVSLPRFIMARRERRCYRLCTEDRLAV